MSPTAALVGSAWKRIALRLTCLLLAGVVVLAATFVFLDGEVISAWVGNALHLGSAGVALFTVLQLAVAASLVAALCLILFKLLPNVQQRWSHLIAASVITTILWIVATLLFREYVQHFGSYNKTYGTIGGVILLLTWMYYTMFVLLAGGELASELHHGSGSLDPLKGATYLGRIVSGEGPGTPSMEKFKPSR